MKKRVLATLLTAAMAASLLGGCGDSNEPAGDQAAPDASTPDVSAPDGTEDADSTGGSASGEAVELTVWGWDASFSGVAFEEADLLDDNVTVHFVEMSKTDCLEKIHTVLASGVTDDLPDIVIISDAAAQGYLMAYPGSFYAMDDTLDYDDFADYKKDYVSYGGIGYGVPFDTGVAGLFYRTDYIEEAGYTEEDMQNLTWEDYFDLGEKLQAKGHALQTYNPNDIAEFQIMLQSCGKWYTDEEGNADFANNDALKECFGVFKTFSDSNYVKTVSDWTEFAGAINGGDVACVLRGSWIAATIKAADDQSGLWRVAPIPTMSQPGATNRSNQGGSSFYVLENSKNAAAAAQFLADTFGGKPELYNTLAEKANIMGTYLPASSVDTYDVEEEFFGGQKINQILAGWIAEIPAVNAGAYTAEAQSALLAVTPEILGGADLDACLAKAEEQFNQIIQE